MVVLQEIHIFKNIKMIYMNKRGIKRFIECEGVNSPPLQLILMNQ